MKLKKFVRRPRVRKTLSTVLFVVTLPVTIVAFIPVGIMLIVAVAKDAMMKPVKA